MCQKMLQAQFSGRGQIELPVKKNYRQEGFSLIELLLVITIIGIIAAVGVPSFQKAKKSAQNTTSLATLRTLSTMQLDFFSHNGRYARPNELNAGANGGLGTTNATLLVRGEYTYKLSPDVNPADIDLKTSYTLIVTRPASSTDPLFIAQVDQSGTITQITP